MWENRHHPCSFKGLMSLYETNYFLLSCLVPNLKALSSHGVSAVARGQDLFIHVIDCSKYTMSIKLTHRFEEQGKAVNLPGLSIRIYFDANQAEVLSWQGDGGFSGIDPMKFKCLASVKAKWDVNLFLVKWLRYCLNVGHSFEGYHSRKRPSARILEI